MKREVEVQKISIKKKVTYPEAVKMVSQEREIQEMQMKINIVHNKISQIKLWIDLKKLVTFIVGVINTTMETKSKT